MKWRFWRKPEDSQKTILYVNLQNLKEAKTFSVEAQSPEKAFELMQKLRKEA